MGPWAGGRCAHPPPLCACAWGFVRERRCGARWGPTRLCGGGPRGSCTCRLAGKEWWLSKHGRHPRSFGASCRATCLFARPHPPRRAAVSAWKACAGCRGRGWPGCVQSRRSSRQPFPALKSGTTPLSCVCRSSVAAGEGSAPDAAAPTVKASPLDIIGDTLVDKDGKEVPASVLRGKVRARASPAGCCAAQCMPVSLRVPLPPRAPSRVPWRHLRCAHFARPAHCTFEASAPSQLLASRSQRFRALSSPWGANGG